MEKFIQLLIKPVLAVQVLRKSQVCSQLGRS